MNCLKAKTDGFHLSSFAHSRDFINDSGNRPLLVENAAGAHFQREFPSLCFGKAADEKEIDFVGLREGEYAWYEVKYQQKVRPGEFAWSEKVRGTIPFTILSRTDYHHEGISIVPAEIFLGCRVPMP